MTRLLILGGSGMLGHKLWQTARGDMETFVTVRDPRTVSPLRLPASEVLAGVDADDLARVIGAIESVRPDAVVNCIGIVKQQAAAKDPLPSIAINALFPHRLAVACRDRGARLIHLSTDCVFSGARGMYREQDVADARDLYGRTKLLGEVDAENAVTLRTSMIGRELAGRSGLLEWFLSNDGGRVRGYDRAVFSGFTTLELSRVIVAIVQRWTALRGIVNVSADRIDKYDLLMRIRDAFGARIAIERDSSVIIDRSLDSEAFRTATGYRPPSWPDMVREMASDPTPYPDWRSTRVP